MQRNAAVRLRLPILVLSAMALLIVTGVAFHGWLQHGSAILLAAGNTALSWCF
jgi:hypothetical protein